MKILSFSREFKKIPCIIIFLMSMTPPFSLCQWQKSLVPPSENLLNMHQEGHQKMRIKISSLLLFKFNASTRRTENAPLIEIYIVRKSKFSHNHEFFESQKNMNYCSFPSKRQDCINANRKRASAKNQLRTPS